MRIIYTIILSCTLTLAYSQSLKRKESSYYREQLEQLAEAGLPGLNEMANFSLAGASLTDLLRGVANTHQLNIHVDPNIQYTVSNNFTNVKVLELLLFLCSEYKLSLETFGNIISLKAKPLIKQPPKVSYHAQEKLLSLEANQDSLGTVVRLVTQASGKNILLAESLSAKPITVFLKEAPLEEGLAKIAEMNGLEMEKSSNDIFIIKGIAPEEQSLAQGQPQLAYNGQSPVMLSGRNQPQGAATPMNSRLQLQHQIINGDTLLTVDAINASLQDIMAEASKRTQKNYLLTTPLEGYASCQLLRTSYEDLLKHILRATEYTYEKQAPNWYIIGKRSQEGLRGSELVRLQFRKVDSLTYAIPEEMRQGVKIQEFKELNSFILSGSQPQIDEIKSFLLAIDQPVPNVLIEVIVANVRKGVGIQTGVQAYLADSVPPTQGQVFPGLDLTLGSNSINQILDKLNGRGLVNLGKVTPNFYVTLQALEQNNLIDVKSTPKLSTLNGHEATLTIGQSRYFLEQMQNITGGVTPITSVSQRFVEVEANLQINVIPFVSGDENITLSITAEFSDFIEPEQPGFPPGSATRQFVSQIRVANEEMIVLGGLEEVGITESSSGVPFLSRIPVLKWLFSSKSREKREDKLIVFIKPTIVY